MASTITDFPTTSEESKTVDLGEGVTGTLTLAGHAGEIPIYSLSIDGEVVFSGTEEQVQSQVVHYRANRTIGPGPRYIQKERRSSKPSGTKRTFEWVLVDE